MPTNTIKRRLWSDKDVAIMKTGARKKEGAKKIATRLNRTEGAVRQKAFSLDLSMNSTYGPGTRRGQKRHARGGTSRSGIARRAARA